MMRFLLFPPEPQGPKKKLTQPIDFLSFYMLHMHLYLCLSSIICASAIISDDLV